MPGEKNSKTIAPATVLPARTSLLIAFGFIALSRVVSGAAAASIRRAISTKTGIAVLEPAQSLWNGRS